MIPATPTCPRCNGPMVMRSSARGQFWGCRAYPNCRGTRDAGAVGSPAPKVTPRPDPKVAPTAPNAHYEPIPIMPGSDEQEAIWEYALHGDAHMVLNCGPGTGKTWTAVQYCLRAPKTMNILFVAFNKHIAAEAQGKLAASGCQNVRASTYHSLGFQILRSHFKATTLDNNKMTAIFERLSPAPLYNKGPWRRALNLAEKLAGFAKNYLLDFTQPNFADELERVADHHGIDMENGDFRDAAALVAPALRECQRTAAVSIDFDDMIWLPVSMDLPYQGHCDVMITDEAQDLNAVQHQMALRIVCPPKSWAKGGRAFIVGDRRQAIYSFRGALTESIDVLTKSLSETKRGVREFPLTITRRCPKLHVQLAQSLFPEIQALEDAPLGEIHQWDLGKAVGEMKAGDMAICRVNKCLVPVAYDLIARGIRPIIKGRDIGEGLLKLVDKLGDAAVVIPIDNEMGRITEALAIYRSEETTRLCALGERAEGRMEAMKDKCECMAEFISRAKSVAELRASIKAIFSDDNPAGAVTLGTVHRTKGLEAARVFVLAPELIPHPMARKPHEAEQERHIAWIAATRAKFDNKRDEPGTLVFCGCIPAIYQQPPKVDPKAHPNGAAIPQDPVEYQQDIALALADRDAYKKAEAACSVQGSGLDRALDTMEAKHDPIIEEDEDDEPPF
jgi:DNA helicase-2/ATP-dependent DNA helicase PcrA